MKKIGIIVAIKEELDEILKIMEEIEQNEICNIMFYKGKIENNQVIVVQSGAGKVNAARITQALIDKFDVKSIINVGSAGALNPNLNIGDIVIANKLIQHDFDITAFNHKKGYVSGVGDYVECDDNLVKKLQNIADCIKCENNKENKQYKITTGIIASGDVFCTDIEMKNEIYSNFKAECVEMEGAAVGQVCYLDNIPFVVIRSISDSPNGNNVIVFEEFVKLASKRCANILKEFLKI